MRTDFFSAIRPKKLDLYILEEVLIVFAGSCAFTLFILLMFQALRLAEFFIIHGTSLIVLSKLTFYLMISFLPTVVPISYLIAILIGIGRLSSDSELIAIKANGVSLFRLTVPLLIVSIGIILLTIQLNTEWVPQSASEFKKIQNKLGNTKVASVINPGTFNSGFFDLLLFADKVDAQNNQLLRVFIFDEREPKNPLTYVSKSAEIVPVKTSGDLSSAIFLRLRNGSMHQNNLDSHTYEKIDFDTYSLYLAIDEGADTAVLKPQMMSQKELIAKIASYPTKGLEGIEFKGEYWRRYAVGMSPFVFVFLGVGFGVFRNRTSKSNAILTGFVLLLIYWGLQTGGSDLLEKGAMPPWLAMQIPNFLMLILGLIAFRRAAW